MTKEELLAKVKKAREAQAAQEAEKQARARAAMEKFKARIAEIRAEKAKQ